MTLADEDTNSKVDDIDSSCKPGFGGGGCSHAVGASLPPPTSAQHCGGCDGKIHHPWRTNRQEIACNSSLAMASRRCLTYAAFRFPKVAETRCLSISSCGFHFPYMRGGMSGLEEEDGASRKRTWRNSVGRRTSGSGLARTASLV